jgi:hypothetical protein
VSPCRSSSIWLKLRRKQRKNDPRRHTKLHEEESRREKKRAEESRREQKRAEERRREQKREENVTAKAQRTQRKQDPQIAGILRIQRRTE